MTTLQPNSAIEASEQAGLSRQFLTFLLADEEYAVDILRVQEIRGWMPVTRLPNTPDYLKGVLNLRGAIIPVIDLRRRFALESLDYGPTTVVVVLRVRSGGQERVMGVVVDAVAETYSIAEADIRPAPPIGVINQEFIRGLATLDDKMIVVLDVDAMMNSGELALTDRITRQSDEGEQG